MSILSSSPPACQIAALLSEGRTSQRNALLDKTERVIGKIVAKGARLVLAAVAQHMPRGVERTQLSILTGYKRSTRDLYVQQGVRAGWLALQGAQIVATDAGLRELGPGFERLPTGDALLRHWLATLPEGERRVLAYVVRYYPHPAPRERIGEAAGYKRSTRDLYVQRLERRRLLESTGAGHVVAAASLFDPPEQAASERGSRP